MNRIFICSAHPYPPVKHEGRVQIFLGYFPPFLRNFHGIFLGGLILSVSSVVLSKVGLNQSIGGLKVMNIGVLVIGGLLTLLLTFMML
jgi:hypothetical protein